MPYTKVHDPWEDSPSTDTPITAAALDQIEEGIADAQALGEGVLSGLSDHVGDTTAAHAASAISAIDEFANSSSTTVQGVLDDLDAAITVNGASITAVDGALTAHLGDTTDAHDASAISLVTTGFDNNLDSSVTNVQLLADAVDELVGGGGGGTTFTTGTAAPTGGADDDLYLETDTGTWWKRISGTWTVIAGVATGPANNSGKFPTSRLRTVTLDSTTADTWTNASKSGSTITLTSGTASVNMAKPNRWMAKYELVTLPGSGQTLTLYGGSLGTIPKIVITNSGGCTLVSGAYTYHVFPTISVGQSITVVGGPGFVLVSMLDSTGGGSDVLDRELFAHPDVNRQTIDALGVKIGATGHGAFVVDSLEFE